MEDRFTFRRYLRLLGLYARMDRVPFASQVNTALFAASLSPFVSEMLWCYPLLTGLPAEPLLRILAALLTGGLAGFLMPILCRHSPNLHKGYSLYNAAAVAGYIGVMLYAVLYHAMDVLPPASASLLLSLESPFGVFFSVLFGAELLTGKMVFGFVLVFAAIIVSEYLPERLAARKGAPKEALQEG